MSDDREEYCAYENAFFPAWQFDDDPRWGKVHRAAPHHTTLGTMIDDAVEIDLVGSLGLPGDSDESPE